MTDGKKIERFVRLVQETLKSIPNTEIFSNYRIENKSGRKREIDVFIKSQIEKCIKLQMKKHQYRKYKEVYQINIDILKQVIKKCDEFEVIFKKENITNNQLAGNLYVIFDEDNNVIDV